MIVVAHAEGIVDRDDQHLAAARGAAGTADKRIGEGQRDQQDQQSHAQRKQQQIAQAAMLDGALRAPLEEHQRAERMRRAAVLAQQVDPERQADDAPAPARNQGARKPTLQPPLADQEVFAHGVVERPVGAEQKIVDVRRRRPCS